jgi:tRNA 2-thiouridine synthesizing protein E
MTSHPSTADPRLDDEGYLIDPEQWSEEFARQVAAREGLTLRDEHWKVIEFMRAYYADRQVAPDARFVIKHLAEQLGYGPQARTLLFQLFPYGYVKQACKVAGMKRPRGWSTG